MFIHYSDAHVDDDADGLASSHVSAGCIHVRETDHSSGDPRHEWALCHSDVRINETANGS